MKRWASFLAVVLFPACLAGVGITALPAQEPPEADKPPPAPFDDRVTIDPEVQAAIDKAVGLRRDCKIRAEGPPLGGSGTLVVVHRGLSSEKLSKDELVEGLAPAGLNAVVGQLGERLAAELDDRNPEGLLRLVKSQLDATSSASLMSKIHAIAGDLVATSAQLRRQMDPEQQGALLAKLDATLCDVKTITGTLRDEASTQNPAAMLGKIHGILSSLSQASQTAAGLLTDNRAAVQTTLSNVQDTTAMIRSNLMPSLLMQMDAATADSLLSKFHVAADRTNSTLGNLQQMTGSAKNLMLVNEESLESMILNLRETSEHLRAAAREIRRNPWRLLYRPTSAEFKQVAVADAARSFSDAAGRLDSAFARLEAYTRTAGANLADDDPHLKQLQEQLAAALNNLAESEKKFWDLLATQH